MKYLVPVFLLVMGQRRPHVHLTDSALELLLFFNTLVYLYKHLFSNIISLYGSFFLQVVFFPTTRRLGELYLFS